MQDWRGLSGIPAMMNFCSGWCFSCLVSCLLMADALAEDAGKDSPPPRESADWFVDATADWRQAASENKGFDIGNGMAVPKGKEASFRSRVHPLGKKVKAASLVIEQSPEWHNWKAVGKVGPKNLEDAPVFLVRGDKDYWLFGLHWPFKDAKNFKPQPAKLEGFDVPLLTTPDPLQFDAPGGLKPGLGGYHAWQSHDMVHWVHHGPVTEKFSRWVTSAEMVGNKTYIYYDFPNDQDPHVYVDDDLTDGIPGKNMGMAFKDPSHGSDSGFIRDLDGRFHVIYEDWTPINAKTHSWDSPLAGHAVSDDGLSHFKILPPAVDQRTKPTGKTGTYKHPHWTKEDPEHWASDVAEYQVHEPEQNAFGDWAPIAIGGRYYLFGDYHPAHQKIRIGCFTSPDINQPFKFCGEIGKGHPDPDIGFAEGQFYLINQTRNDYVSPGPWVGEVEVRVGVDTNGDGTVNQWSEWQLVKESYQRIEGFAKQIKRIPASMDLSELPAGEGFAFEVRVKDGTSNDSKPILDRVTMSFSD